MIKTIFDVLNSKKLTISVAESITGGALSKKLMSLAGSSSFFKGSLVAYSDESKIEILKIQKEKIRKHSAVSHQIAGLMASNVKNLFKSDIGFSTTGNAGPGLNDEKSSVGELYISFHFKNKTKTKFFKLQGNRDANINKAVKVSLEFISENLDK